VFPAAKEFNGQRPTFNLGQAATRALSAQRLLTSEYTWSYVTVVAIVAGLTVTALALGHLTAFYSIDGDVKYLGAVSISHHFLDPSIPYPFHRFDPSGQYTLPLTAWYGGHDYAGYSLPFEYIAGASIWLLGTTGVILPSIVATGLLLIVQMELASLVGLAGRRSLLLAATVAASPVLFYAVSFWEHAWGVALLLAGIAVLLRAIRRDHPAWVGALAGFLLAGGVLMRRETAIPATLLLVLVPLVSLRRRTTMTCLFAAAGFALPLGAIVLLHPEPLLLGLTHASPGRAGTGVGHAAGTLQKFEWIASGGYATGMLAAGTVLLVLARRFRPGLTPAIFAAGSFVAGLALVIQLLSNFTYANDNPLAFCPLAIWGFWSVIVLPVERASRQIVIALWVLLAASTIVIAIAMYDYGGAQWGPRYLLFVFPILLVLAFRTRQELISAFQGAVHQRMINHSFATLLLMSVLLQGLGLLDLSVKQSEAARADAGYARVHASVVVSPWPKIDVLAPFYGHATLLYAATQPALDRLMSTLRHRGFHSVMMLCDPVCDRTAYPGWSNSRRRWASGDSFTYRIYSRMRPSRS
jgi:hypothetical protein